MKTAIVTDSNSGVTQIEAQKMNVFVLPMPVIIEGQAYYEGIDLLPDQFFRALTERQAVSTSQPSPGDVTALWDKVLTEYDELVYIPMSSGLSASCATAQMLAEDYEGRVFVVDNHRISSLRKAPRGTPWLCGRRAAGHRRSSGSWRPAGWIPLCMWAWRPWNISAGAGA